MLSDRGPEFTSGVAKGVYKMLGAKKKFTSAYHPQTDGMVDRLNNTFCQMLSHLVEDGQYDWDEMLPHALAEHISNAVRVTAVAPSLVHLEGIRGCP